MQWPLTITPEELARFERDAFGLQRVSTPHTLFSAKSLMGLDSGIWQDILTSGATSTFDVNRASVTLDTTSTIGSSAIRQTRYWWNYQPSKSQRFFLTFVMGAIVAGVTKRVGYYDDEDGIYLEHDSTTAKVVIRSHISGAAVNTEVDQADWNVDKFDGTGVSGITLDFTKAQIFHCDFEWLGVGSVRCGFVIDGRVLYCHQFDHSNSSTGVYMSSPNLPLRYEIINVAAVAADSLECICGAVSSEGGNTSLNRLRTANRGNTTLSISAGVTRALVQIRKKTTAKKAAVVPIKFSTLNISSGSFLWAIVVNPTVTGGTAVWTSGGTAVEYDISQGGTVSGGLTLDSGYVSSDVNYAGVPIDIDNVFGIGQNNDGTSDIIVLAITSIGNDSYLGSLTWREYY